MLEVKRKYCGSERKIKKSSIKTRSRTFRALYCWGKIIGVNPLSLTENNDLEFSYFGLFYGCLLGAICLYVYYRALVHRGLLFVPQQTPVAVIVDIMGITWQSFETLSTLLVFAIYQNRIKIIVQSFVTVEKTSRKLGIQDDYDRYLRTFATYVTVCNVTSVVLMSYSETMWSYIHPSDKLVWWILNLTTMPSFNTGLLFIWSLIFVDHKFRGLNEKLRFLMQNKYSKGNKTFVVSLRWTRSSSSRSDYLSDRINVISQLHRELRNVIPRIEEHFMPLVLLTIGKFFTYITLHIYLLYRYTKGHTPLGKMDFVFLGAVSYSLLNAFNALLMISNVCGSTSYEANSTGNVLHSMLNNNKTFDDSQEAAKINMLSLDLLRNRVDISVLGLFKLNHFFVYSIVATVITHLTIMLQLYN